MVETHSRLLLQSALEEVHRQAVIQVVSLLVDCASTPGQYPTEETLSSIPFAVWYTIQVTQKFYFLDVYFFSILK